MFLRVAFEMVGIVIAAVLLTGMIGAAWLVNNDHED